MLQTSHKAIERVSALSDAEVSLNFAAFAGFKPLLVNLLLVKLRVCRPSSELRTVQVNAKAVAVPNVFARSDDRIRENALGIIPVCLPISLKEATTDALQVLST